MSWSNGEQRSDSLKNISFLMRSDDRVFITQNNPWFEDLRVPIWSLLSCLENWILQLASNEKPPRKCSVVVSRHSQKLTLGECWLSKKFFWRKCKFQLNISYWILKNFKEKPTVCTALRAFDVCNICPFFPHLKNHTNFKFSRCYLSCYAESKRFPKFNPNLYVCRNM